MVKGPMTINDDDDDDESRKTIQEANIYAILLDCRKDTTKAMTRGEDGRFDQGK